ncbi:MAG: polymerase primary sigma factor [Actinomycetota bacterium]|jgi:RNA polymerase sigma factor (sigma-70 family)|nr:polymerase primary sigma factor [Actinomycetota bacterium]MDQ1665676.1 polymerase primary sigma factor [Actinomycetota bacterium]
MPALTNVTDVTEETMIRDDDAVATRDLDEVAPAADLMRVYLNEIGRTPLLSAQQEVELSRRIEAGVYAAELLRRHEAGEDKIPARRRRELAMVADDGADAKDHMLRANLRLVVSVAKKFGNRGVPLGDIIQEGNVGLVRAVEKFDYAKGFKFSTYAMWWIRQSIGRGLPELSRTIRLPVHVNEEVAKVARARRELLQRLNRTADNDEIAEHTGLTSARVAELSRLGRDPVSLDAPVGDEDDTRFGDLLVDIGGVSTEQSVEHQAMVNQLNELVDILPEREATIVRMRFGLYDGNPRTLDEIGRALGLTRERIRQLEKLALAKLRHPSVTQQMLDWAS